MKILIADDSKESRTILRKTLETDGHTIEEAYNGKEALRLAKIFSPDMIISDVLMPEMDGFKFCIEIKKDPKFKEIPFIFYTAAYVDPQDEQLAFSLGASGFIIKPMETDVFLETIKDMLAKSPKEKPVLSGKIRKQEKSIYMRHVDSVERMLDLKVKDLQLYKEMFINSTDAIAIIDTEGRYQERNEAHKNIFGFADEELKGKTPAIHLGESSFIELMKRLSVDRYYRGELESITKEGKMIYVELSAFPIENEKGETTCYVGISRDITNRILSERKIKAIAVENENLYIDLQQMFINTITSLASIIDAKSKWTKGHSERVTWYAVAIGMAMGLDKHDLETLRIGGLLHDLGKIGIHDDLLNKTGTLTEEEKQLIHEHPKNGAKILEPIKQMKSIVPLIKHHHERFDGTGYPDGLKGENIPLLARILCVADTYDSTVSDRPYRKSPRLEFAVSELKRCSGTQLDPDIVKIFLDLPEIKYQFSSKI